MGIDLNAKKCPIINSYIVSFPELAISLIQTVSIILVEKHFAFLQK